MENNKRDILGVNVNIVKLFLIFLGIPFLGYMFYTGNHGNFYGYYLTGYYLIIILVVSWLASYLWRDKVGKILVILGLIVFLIFNLNQTFKKLGTVILDSKEIVLQNQLIAIGWIKADAQEENFNIDIYVPPVIPHSYKYLLLWTDIKQEEKEVKLLYTLYELDPPHPERLEAWLTRQASIGEVLVEKQFGGIVVQRRERIYYEK